MQRFFKPLPGRQTRDPITGEVLPPAGAWRESSTFYERRLLDGDIEEATPPAEPPARAGKSASKE